MLKTALRALALALPLLASSTASAGVARPPQTAAPYDRYVAWLSGLDEDCEGEDAPYCFPRILGEALAAAPDGASVLETLGPAVRRMRSGTLEVSWGAALRGQALAASEAEAAPPGFGAPDVRRLAFLVSVSDYDELPKLPGARRNADLMKEVLTKAGFEIHEWRDPTYPQLLRAKEDFAAILQEGSADKTLAFVYLYGHGLSRSDERFVCPRDAALRRLSQAPRECAPVASFDLSDFAPSILVIEADFDPAPDAVAR